MIVEFIAAGLLMNLSHALGQSKGFSTGMAIGPWAIVGITRYNVGPMTLLQRRDCFELRC